MPLVIQGFIDGFSLIYLTYVSNIVIAKLSKFNNVSSNNTKVTVCGRIRGEACCLNLQKFQNKKFYDDEQRKKNRFLDCQKGDNRSHSRDLLV